MFRQSLVLAALLGVASAHAADPAWCRTAPVLKADANGPCLVQRVLAEEAARKAAKAQALSEQQENSRLRQVAAEEQRAAAEAARAERERGAAQRSAEFEAEQARKREAQAAQYALMRAEAASEAAHWKRQSDALQQSLAASERAAERQQSAARKTCGEDFGKPRVGMELERAKTCLGYARLVGQVNRKDGVASVYTNDRVQLIVMDNKVVAWQGLR